MLKKRKTKELNLKAKKRFMIVLYGSAFFFIISVLVFAIIFYFAYLFDITFLKISFQIVLILMSIFIYYILLEEFIKSLYNPLKK